MFWIEEWKRVSARVAGLISAAEVVAHDPTRLGVPQYLHNQWNGVFNSIDEFFVGFGADVPSEALNCFQNFKVTYKTVIGAQNPEHAPSRLAYLVALKSELDFHLFSPENLLAGTSERAFLHLQRLIVADDDVRVKWQKVFGQGEVECERLGGAHLLHHGIWAFKANAAGGRTDLVLGEPLIPNDVYRRALEGLVLTEWKLVSKSSETSAIAASARSQAEKYTTGVLGGFELHRVRYIVLVSAQELPDEPDFSTVNAVYRHINIATEPRVPSKASKN